MKKHWLTVCLLATILAAGPILCHAEDPYDPGAPDSVIIDISCALQYGSDSLVVPIIVVNDEPLASVTIPIYYLSPDKYWKIDTAYFRSDRWQYLGAQGFVDHFDIHPDTAKYLTYVSAM
ncbi:MAG: hypothetical protein GY869_29460, partial [Planctomycetes bacterium]|nr:hypothetical protein [Planctomycetota bacterium]